METQRYPPEFAHSVHAWLFPDATDAELQRLYSGTFYGAKWQVWWAMQGIKQAIYAELPAWLRRLLGEASS